MLDMVEKRIAMTFPAVAAQGVFSGLNKDNSLFQMKLFLKVLSNYMQQPTPYVSSELLSVLSKSEISEDEIERQVIAIFEHMVREGTNTPTTTKMYTTGQLATFFGVTVATINNWLKNGRILGAQKAGANKQYRIPETAIYKSASNEDIPISEIVKLYEEEKRQTSLRPMTPTQEQKEILDAIVFFEDKYGGVYEKTLGAKGREQSSLEKRDADQWKYLLRCINGEHEQPPSTH